MVLVAWRTRGELAPAAPKKRRRTLAQAIANLNGAMNHEPRRLVAGSHAARIAKHIAPGQKLCNVRAGERAVPTWAIPEVFGRTNEAERVVLIAIRALRRTNRLRDYGDADPVTEATIARHVGRNVADILAALINKGYVRKVTRRYDLTHTFNGKYRRLCWDEPSLTVDTRFGEPRYFLHPDEARGFSVREAARIQGLPDDFTLLGPDREQFRMTGNAIPLQMAVHLGQLARSLVR